MSTDANGALTCKSVSTGSFMVTANCGANQALISTSQCVALGTGVTDPNLSTHITNTQTNVQNLQTQVNNLAAGGGRGAIYVGNTPTATVGAVTVAGQDKGLNSANAMCNSAFAGSHMCSMPEMYNTVVAGKLHMADTIAKAWIFMPSWTAPASTSPVAGLPGNEDTPYAGTADNCGSMTYPTADRKWTGIAVTWGLLSTGAAGFRFYGGTQATCHDSYPIACCK